MTDLLLVGSTGLVGESLLQQALSHPGVDSVVAVTRRPLDHQASHPKLQNPVVDFDNLPETAPWWTVDAVICTLGTTMVKAGSRQAFRKVDHDYPLAFAMLARHSGAATFVLNSALGANPKSLLFYSRTKGETEVDLAQLGFDSLTLVRPGLIGGARTEHRPAEALALKLSMLVEPLLPFRYRVVPAERIARALLAAALVASPGRRVIESERL
ncbi:MAG: hypothetical protein ACSLE5_06830 [Porticoccaceae bacterium]